MSIVVAVRTEEQFVVAADRLVCFGETERVDPANSTTSKIMKIGDSLVGATGWAIYDDILRDHLHDHQKPVLHDEGMIFTFFLELWKALHEKYPFVNDQASSKDTPFGDLDATFLIANRSGMYKVSSDMGITRFQQYFAIGSGSDYALGAIHALYRPDGDAEAIARAAVEAAISFNMYCGGPVDVMSVD